MSRLLQQIRLTLWDYNLDLSLSYHSGNRLGFPLFLYVLYQIALHLSTLLRTFLYFFTFLYIFMYSKFHNEIHDLLPSYQLRQREFHKYADEIALQLYTASYSVPVQTIRSYSNLSCCYKMDGSRWDFTISNDLGDLSADSDFAIL